MYRMTILFFLIYLPVLPLPGFQASAQNLKIDSLLNFLKTDREDTNKVSHLYSLGRELIYKSPDSTILLSYTALNLSKKLSWKKGLAISYGLLGTSYGFMGDFSKSLQYLLKALRVDEEIGNKNRIAAWTSLIGNVYLNQANYFKALDYYNKSMNMDEVLGNKQGIATNLGTIGLVYNALADYPKSLEHYFKALKMDKELGNKNGIASHLTNIGNIYLNQSDYPKALEYYLMALKIAVEVGDKNVIATIKGNMGIVYKEKTDYPKALEYYFMALKLDNELGDKNGIAGRLNNIGIIYHEQAKKAYIQANLTTGDSLYKKALEYYFNALKINEKTKNKSWEANNLCNLGTLYVETGKFKKAEEYLKKAISISDSIGTLNELSQFEEALSDLYMQTNRYQLAYEHYKKSSILKNSIFNEEKSKVIGKLEAKHEYELAEVKRKQVEEEHQRQLSVTVGRRNKLQYSGIMIFLVLLVIVLLLVARRNIPIRLVEGVLFFTFLLFFEFLLVLMDPYIEQFTGGEPMYKLIFNAVVAAVIFPVHAFFEGWVKRRLLRHKRK